MRACCSPFSRFSDWGPTCAKGMLFLGMHQGGSSHALHHMFHTSSAGTSGQMTSTSRPSSRRILRHSSSPNSMTVGRPRMFVFHMLPCTAVRRALSYANLLCVAVHGDYQAWQPHVLCCGGGPHPNESPWSSSSSVSPSKGRPRLPSGKSAFHMQDYLRKATGGRCSMNQHRQNLTCGDGAALQCSVSREWCGLGTR